MNAAVFCPGLSLARWMENPPPAEVRIGVNRAAVAIACDVYAALDYPQVRDNAARIVGGPNLLTRRQTLLDLARLPWRIARFPRVMLIEESIEGIAIPGPWLERTMMAAIAFAVGSGASRIGLYGCDFDGVTDFDGFVDEEATRSRTPDRWVTERGLIASAVAALRELGIDLILH